MRVALSHDWLNGMRGGEKCLEAFCELYPESDIFTLFCEKEKISAVIRSHSIRSSWLERFPNVFDYYRYYLPLFPSAVGSFKLKDYDLVISSSHCAAKGIRKDPKAVHVCYCFTPMRYAWALFDDYFGNKNFFAKSAIRWIVRRLREWDKRTNGSIDHFLAISKHVQRRIREYYQRESRVIYPPVDTEFYTPDPDTAREDFYLIVSALVPYKKIDTAIAAFNRLGRPLVIIGDGPEKKALESRAKGRIRFLGWQEDRILKDYYRRARALVFPGEEDFGIVPVEAQACGCPVIALGKGGALETIHKNRTGIFFEEPNEESLAEAILDFEKRRFEVSEVRENSVRFGRERFKREIKEFMNGITS